MIALLQSRPGVIIGSPHLPGGLSKCRAPVADTTFKWEFKGHRKVAMRNRYSAQAVVVSALITVGCDTPDLSSAIDTRGSSRTLMRAFSGQARWLNVIERRDERFGYSSY